jgi:hypothetical protein
MVYARSTPFNPLRRFAATSALIALLSPLVAAGEDDDSLGKQPLTETRREMLQEYKFTPAGTKTAALPSSLISEAPALPKTGVSTPRDVVRMAPFEVRESAETSATLSSAAAPKPDTPGGRAAAKLGIGVHHLEIGKVHVFVNTIFYLPFLVGFEW